MGSAATSAGIGHGFPELHVHTVHGFCARLLRDEADEAGLDPFVVTVAHADRLAMLLERVDELRLRLHDFRGDPASMLAGVLGRIDRLKDAAVTADEVEAWASGLPAADERAERERHRAAAGQAGGGNAARVPAGREHGDDRERGEPAEGEAQQQADADAGRLRQRARAGEVRAPPQRDVEDGDERHGEAGVPREGRARPVARAAGPAGEKARGEGGCSGERAEGEHEIEAEDHEVLRLAQQSRVEPGRGERRRHAEHDAADEADAGGRPQRRAEGRAGRRAPAEDEPVEAAVEVPEPPQLLADRVHRGERGALLVHQGRPLNL